MPEIARQIKLALSSAVTDLTSSHKSGSLLSEEGLRIYLLFISSPRNNYCLSVDYRELYNQLYRKSLNGLTLTTLHEIVLLIF